MSVKVEKIAGGLTLGEGPHWHDQHKALYYVDINTKNIHKYVPATGKHTKATLDGRVGFIVPVEGSSDEFLVGVERQFRVVRWAGGDGGAAPGRLLREVDADRPTTRINDGKADPRGRVFAGTMGREENGEFEKGQGSLFRVEDGKVVKLTQGVGISNGLAWDLEEKAFYYIDSLERKIRRYDYEVESGEISNMTYIFDLEKHKQDGFPDGCTIDVDGNLWVAVFNGSCILKISPKTGELLQKVTIPKQQVTSATWGGDSLDELYVTSADTAAGAQADGALFRVTGLGTRGLPNVNFRL